MLTLALLSLPGLPGCCCRGASALRCTSAHASAPPTEVARPPDPTSSPPTERLPDVQASTPEAPVASVPVPPSERPTEMVGLWLIDVQRTAADQVELELREEEARLAGLPPDQREAAEAQRPSHAARLLRASLGARRAGLVLELRPDGGATFFPDRPPPMAPKVGTWSYGEGRIHVRLRVMDGTWTESSPPSVESFRWEDGGIGIPMEKGAAMWFRRAPESEALPDVPVFPSDLLGDWSLDAAESARSMLPSIESGVRAQLAGRAAGPQSLMERLLPPRERMLELVTQAIGASTSLTLTLQASGGMSQRLWSPTGSQVETGCWEVRGDRLVLTTKVRDGVPLPADAPSRASIQIEAGRLRLPIPEGRAAGGSAWLKKSDPGAAPPAPTSAGAEVVLPTLPPAPEMPSIETDADLVGTWVQDVDHMGHDLGASYMERARQWVEQAPPGQRQLRAAVLPAPDLLLSVLREAVPRDASRLTLDAGGRVTLERVQASGTATLTGTWLRQGDQVRIGWTHRDGTELPAERRGSGSLNIVGGRLAMPLQEPTRTHWLRRE